MSAAPKLAPREREAASVGTAVRPVRRKRFPLGRVLVIASIWAAGMVLSLIQIDRAAEIRAARADILRIQSEIARLEQRNLELEARIANAVTVAEVERWALAHGMNPPTGIAGTLAGNPEAVAVRDRSPVAAVAAAETEAGPADAPEAPEAAPSLWETLVARLTGREPVAQAAAGPRPDHQ